MLELITRLVQPIVQIRRDEWRKAIPMFLYFAFTIATLYILKPIRSALFLTAHGAENLRYAYIGEGTLLLLVTVAYVRLSGWLAHRHTLFSVATVFFITNVLAFWFLFHLGYGQQISFLFYVWVATYSITIVTQFWTLANDIFNPREAKRLFGFILSGGSLGGVIGGLLTNRTAERVGTENLLLVVVVLLAISLLLIHFVLRREPRPEPAPSLAQEESGSEARQQPTWRLFYSSRYLVLIVALVMIAKTASTLIDNQFNAVVERSILEKNARTAFFGGFMAFLNVVSFVLQLVVASYVLRRFGIALSLLLLPLGLCFGSAATLFFPTLFVSAYTKVYDGSMNYSISQLGKEILYIPIRSNIRYRVKPIIDMLGYRASKSVAGLFIIFVTALLGIPDEKLGLVVIFLIPLWVFVIWTVRDEYTETIRELLATPVEADSTVIGEKVESALSSLEGKQSFEKVREFLTHPSGVARKLAATACHAFACSGEHLGHTKKLVQAMMEYEAVGLKKTDLDLLCREVGLGSNDFLDRARSLMFKIAPYPAIDLIKRIRSDQKLILPKLSRALSEPAGEVRCKRAAILILAALGTQEAVHLLLHHLVLTPDCSIRFNLIWALNRIRSSGERHQFDGVVIRNEILGEVERYVSILSLVRGYRKQIPNSGINGRCLGVVLEAMRLQNLERIFRLLALVYPGDIILVIYNRLSELKPDPSIEAHAVELLENVLEPRLARTVAPVFEAAEDVLAADQLLEPLARHFLGGNDPWLAVCAIFLVAELGIESCYPLLRDQSHSPHPMVSEAAMVALDQVELKRST